MNETTDHSSTVERGNDLPTLVTIICHLMTCYALRPCEPLAVNINRHMDILLNSPAADGLGEWRATFRQLHIQWKGIANRHSIRQQKKAMVETGHTISH